MSPFEALISLISPLSCLRCKTEGAVACASCLKAHVPPLPGRCYLCNINLAQGVACADCLRQISLKNVWAVAGYDGLAKDLVGALKFSYVRAAAKPMAHLMAASLPPLRSDVLLVHAPAATSRVRQRGFDQAQLLAKALARELDLSYSPLLARLGQHRQVGNKREARLLQAAGSFRVRNPSKVQGARIILVDDVLTTGATLEAAAHVLYDAGAQSVGAVVFAQA